MTRAFISYSHVDDALRAELDKHLALLRRQGLLDTWSDHRIPAGGDFDTHISHELEDADLIMLLVSSDFMASDYCFSKEMARAMERHHEGTAAVLPIILRPCDWHSAPFGMLKALPKDGKAVVKWPTMDDAFLDIVQSLRSQLTSESTSAQAPRADGASASGDVVQVSAPRPRSGSLHLAREFTDMDRDNFLDESFAYIQTYFRNSLDDLGERNPGVEGRQRRISDVGFTATIYRDGKKVSGCYIRISTGFGRDRNIGYSGNDSPQENSYNDLLSVDADRHSLQLKAMMSSWTGSDSRLTQEGASERLWQLFINNLT